MQMHIHLLTQTHTHTYLHTCIHTHPHRQVRIQSQIRNHKLGAGNPQGGHFKLIRLCVFVCVCVSELEGCAGGEGNILTTCFWRRPARERRKFAAPMCARDDRLSRAMCAPARAILNYTRASLIPTRAILTPARLPTCARLAPCVCDFGRLRPRLAQKFTPERSQNDPTNPDRLQNNPRITPERPQNDHRTAPERLQDNPRKIQE